MTRLPLDSQADMLQFETRTVSGKFDFWRENVSNFCDATPIHPLPTTNFFQLRQFFSDRIFLGQTQYGAKAAIHANRHIQDTGHIVRIQRYFSGGMIGQFQDVPFEIRPGMIAVIDQSNPYEALHDDSLTQSIYVSRATLDLETDTPFAPLVLAPDHPLTQVLHNEFDRMYMPLLAGARSLSIDRIDRFSACLKMAVHKGQQDKDVRAKARDALRDLISEHIEKHLESPDLTVASLLKAFGVSRASLFRMFEPEGGVRRYITTRRLFRAIHMISTNPLRRGQVTQAAERWGFSSNVDIYSKAQRGFGTSPGALIHLPLNPVYTTMQYAPFSDFMDKTRSQLGFESVRSAA